MMVVVVDYSAGNVRSVCNAIQRLGIDATLSSDPRIISSAQRVILPGVGHATRAMESLNQLGLIDTIKSLTQPVLGICIGMQIMCIDSQEGDTQGLGIFETKVRRLDNQNGTINIPHTGWNTIENLRSPLFESIDKNAYLYYVHSYAADVCDQSVATTNYGNDFSAALRHENFYGTQFHPEKSGEIGEKILGNFMKL